MKGLVRNLFLSAVFAIVAGSGCTRVIGPDASDTDLKGNVVQAEVPQGEFYTLYNTRLAADHLKSGRGYSYDSPGTLTIDGDIPANVTLEVHGSKLTINGNVGADCSVAAYKGDKGSSQDLQIKITGTLGKGVTIKSDARAEVHGQSFKARTPSDDAPVFIPGVGIY